MAVGKIMSANVILVMLAPKPKEKNKIDIEVTQNSVKIDNLHQMITEF